MALESVISENVGLGAVNGFSITLHVPVPINTLLPVNVVELALHKNWSAPTIACVGIGVTVTVTSSVFGVHVPFEMVYLNT